MTWPPLPSIDATTIALWTGLAGKLFIMAAESMPAPPPDCGYARRWIYDFLQLAASNRDRVGAVRMSGAATAIPRLAPPPQAPAAGETQPTPPA